MSVQTVQDLQCLLQDFQLVEGACTLDLGLLTLSGNVLNSGLVELDDSGRREDVRQFLEKTFLDGMNAKVIDNELQGNLE